jgi:uncharacterized protein YggE
MRGRVAVAGIVALGLAAGARAEEPPPAITVSGTGTVSAAPDTGHVTAGVVSEAATASEAARANATAMATVLAAIEAAGVEKKDVRTQGFSVTPVYEHYEMVQGRARAPKIVGYRVANQVVVKIRAIDKVGDVLDRVVSAGANEIQGISFSIAEPAPLFDEARKRAVADARRRAEVYATAAGVSLGRLLRLDESAGFVPMPEPRMARMEAAADATTPIAAGELDLTVSITASYAIAP